MVAGGSSDQVACVHPHKPQLAEIGFFQQFQNGVDVILSCHFFAALLYVFLIPACAIILMFFFRYFKVFTN
nr:MAG TPA: hypothetical protein [Caudoviricetes sp.]